MNFSIDSSCSISDSNSFLVLTINFFGITKKKTHTRSGVTLSGITLILILYVVSRKIRLRLDLLPGVTIETHGIKTQCDPVFLGRNTTTLVSTKISVRKYYILNKIGTYIHMCREQKSRSDLGLRSGPMCNCDD